VYGSKNLNLGTYFSSLRITMSDEDNKKDRIQITTSALMTKRQEEEVLKQLEEKIRGEEATQEDHKVAVSESIEATLARPKVAPWTKSEPLTKIHSILGHIAQGDIYRNDLDLVYDRLTGDAEAPEYLPAQQDEEDAEEAFEPLVSAESTPWNMDDFGFGEIAGSVSIEVNKAQAMETPEPEPGQEQEPEQESKPEPKSAQEPEPKSEQEPEPKLPEASVNIHSEEPIHDAYASTNSSQILGGMNLDEFDSLQQTARSSGTSTKADVNEFLSKHAMNSISDNEIDQLSGGEDDWIPQSSAPLENDEAIPVRERQISQKAQPFFTQNDTFSEGTFAHEGEDHQSESAKDSFEDGFGKGLGDAEDTIVD
jgi:hypothetical protein